MTILQGGGAGDSLQGYGDDDLIKGSNGDDRIKGSNGADSLNGGAGDDTINGGQGDDFLVGSEGNDYLVGSDGNDRLAGGPGSDVLSGGSGNDTFYFDNLSVAGDRDIINDFELGIDRVRLDGVAIAGVVDSSVGAVLTLDSGAEIVFRGLTADNVMNDVDFF